MNQQNLAAGIKYLADHGLNLYAVFDCATLPADIGQMIAATGLSPADYARLVLLGNGGTGFWPALQAYGMRTEHPVDHFSLTLAQTFITGYLGDPPTLIAYPGDYAIPLQRLGQLAGWSHPSPLGLGISPVYGVWFAYRVAFFTTLPLPVTEQFITQSPCDTCLDKPCISACPVRAVRGIDVFDIPTCMDYRLSSNTTCADRCLSRLACPYFPQHRYPLAQVQYHYRRSLESIRLYYDGMDYE
ncbi:MAG: hypothetical protein R3264_19405 [Anaerolineae bacterium]|nr:hypothetical protein [Anaerolineae bacterium]